MNRVKVRYGDDKERTIVAPPVDVYETEKEIRLEAEMPGLERESLDLQLRGNELSIRGVRREEKLPGGVTALYRERCPYEYARSFVLGNDVNREGIDAKYENGILAVTIPKTEAKQPRRITIN